MLEEDKKVDLNNQQENKNKPSLSERIEDINDAVFETLEDVTMGPKKDFNKDIPATYYSGNGARKVNKIQTRKNINKRILGKHGVKIIVIIIAIGLIVSLIYYLINLLLLA